METSLPGWRSRQLSAGLGAFGRPRAATRFLRRLRGNLTLLRLRRRRMRHHRPIESLRRAYSSSARKAAWRRYARRQNDSPCRLPLLDARINPPSPSGNHKDNGRRRRRAHPAAFWPERRWPGQNTAAARRCTQAGAHTLFQSLRRGQPGDQPQRGFRLAASVAASRIPRKSFLTWIVHCNLLAWPSN